MEKRVLTVLFLFSIFTNSFGSGEFSVTGARAAAMGFSSVAVSDEWSAFNNPGGLANFRKYSAGFYFENRFLVEEMSLKAVTVTLPVWRGTFGLALLHNGFSLYSEIKGGIGYGMSFGKYVSGGIQLNVLRISQSEGYGNKNFFSFDAGVQLRASEHITVGVHIANPLSSRISEDFPERLPATIRLGLLWKISKTVLTTVEAEKDLTHKPVFRVGLEYHLAKPLYARIGFMTNPTLFTIGTGMEFGSFRFDLASGYHLVLGYSPQASVTYRFK
jgi:hypothetical protein